MHLVKKKRFTLLPSSFNIVYNKVYANDVAVFHDGHRRDKIRIQVSDTNKQGSE